MKLPQDQAIWIHAFITAVFAAAFVALIIFSHNASAVEFSLAAIPTLYAIWVPSPVQQSTTTAVMALVQKLEPIVTSLIASSAQPATTPAPAQAPTTQPAQPAATQETDVTASMKAVSPPAKETTA